MPTSNAYTNTTLNTAATTYLNKTYYDKNLLVNAKTEMKHAQFAQKKTIPNGSGDNAEFRRWTLFDPAKIMTGLTEGVTPDGQSLSQEHVTVKCKAYGAFVEVSDWLKRTSYDNVMTGSTDLLGDQIGRALDWLVRDCMASGTNVQYSGGKASRNLLEATGSGATLLTVTELRKAVRTLKKAKARPFKRNGKDYFVAIVSPDATFDLQDDALWQDVSKYQYGEQIFTGEIGKIMGVIVVESTEAKVFKQSVCCQADGAGSSATSLVIQGETADMEAYLSVPGNKFYVGSTEVEVVSYAAASKTVTLKTAATWSDEDPVWTDDAGKPDTTTKAAPDVHATLVCGEDAYGTVDIGGSGSMETIIHSEGSTSDPINQRITVAGKVPSFGCVILNENWLLRIEHCVTA